DAGDENLVEGVIEQHNIESIVHFAGSVVVPDSMRDPLGYYRNNTFTTRSLLNAAVKSGVNRFIFSSTAAVYGNPDQVPVPEIALEAATGQRAKIDVFGTDYPTPDGSCIRDFVHVSDLAQAHRAALSYLRGSGDSVTLNCGYGHGYSVLETIEAVRRISGRNF